MPDGSSVPVLTASQNPHATRPRGTLVRTGCSGTEGHPDRVDWAPGTNIVIDVDTSDRYWRSESHGAGAVPSQICFRTNVEHDYVSIPHEILFLQMQHISQMHGRPICCGSVSVGRFTMADCKKRLSTGTSGTGTPALHWCIETAPHRKMEQ